MDAETWNKRVVVQVARLTRHIGQEVQQPVIPPLSRAGGVCCSVNPASHSTLQSRAKETQAFA